MLLFFCHNDNRLLNSADDMGAKWESINIKKSNIASIMEYKECKVDEAQPLERLAFQDGGLNLLYEDPQYGSSIP